jgi:hypothetical protein
MSRTITGRDAWHPETKQEREAVLQELQEVLASPHFCNSKRYPALLKYITEKTLMGHGETLKERTIGVEVFDRPPSYDTNSDTVVRYTAGEVRKRLSLYYHELDRRPAIQISLPAGSYVPEFVLTNEGREEALPTAAETALSQHGRVEIAPATWRGGEGDAPSEAQTVAMYETGRVAEGVHGRGLRWKMFAGVMVVLMVLAASVWRFRSVEAKTPVDEFWAPLLHDKKPVTVCSGGVIFREGYSGVVTANKDIDYPFVSSQIASSIATLSGLVERKGATMDLHFAASTPLTILREQPIVLLGGYNNQWTMRLMESLPYHFGPSDAPSIIENGKPGVKWMRDQSLPYSSADDYALLVRFRDETTDSWIVVLAGLGRNGTEAAAQFVTSPHYMQLLSDQVGGAFSNKNVEAVLKVSVVDGKTGAPSMLAAKAW